MQIDIHFIQNHSPSNLNRDDLGAPKTCYFGGTLRSRISSQCLKRSIRMSEQFGDLLGGIRTRQLADLIVRTADYKVEKTKVLKILDLCGIKAKKEDKSDMLVYTSKPAIQKIAALMVNNKGGLEELGIKVGEIIANEVAVPDMALSGRMLETGVLKNTTVEAALQVAHAISTHSARPEIDYYVAADDIPGEDAGAGFLDEAQFSSACFYKFFSINWETLVSNLSNAGETHKELAAHTVGSFLLGAAKSNPSGKQNSFAAHNPPDGILIEFRKPSINYANAFAIPVGEGQRGIIGQSIAQLGQYVLDLDEGYGKPEKRFWFSPNLRYPLTGVSDKKEIELADKNLKSLEELVIEVVKELGFDWNSVKTIKEQYPVVV